ncbi:recombinase RecT [uncultured Shewanella sp.]|uniref:recombinase RecT n=1 Tax=uncultured Shewanella sp. TaxID=173975 RepID=UPI0026369DFE|nr:recombinase RecT [uncultured Shewanella sp.]
MELQPYLDSLSSIENEYKQASKNYPRSDLIFRQEANAIVRQFIILQGDHYPLPRLALAECLMRAVRLGLSLLDQRKECFLQLNYQMNFVTLSLAIGYRGYQRIFCGSGLLNRIDVGLVYANDTFRYQGPRMEVIHSTSCLSTDVSVRGQLEGGYCIAEVSDGSLMTTVMSRSQIDEVEMMARLYGHEKSWDSEFKGECIRAAIIRFSAKNWFRISPNIDVDNLAIQELEDQFNGVSEEGQSYDPK